MESVRGRARIAAAGVQFAQPELMALRCPELRVLNVRVKSAEASGILRSDVSGVKGVEVCGIKGVAVSGFKSFEASGIECVEVYGMVGDISSSRFFHELEIAAFARRIGGISSY